MSEPMHRRPPIPDISDWFDSFGPMAGWRSMRGQLQGIRIEDYQDGEDYVVRAELPGVDPEQDVDLSVQRGVLTIRAERREEQHDKHHSEFHYGSSTRSIPLPDGAQDNDVRADYKDGVLTIRVPCVQPPAQARKISVTRTE